MPTTVTFPKVYLPMLLRRRDGHAVQRGFFHKQALRAKQRRALADILNTRHRPDELRRGKLPRNVKQLRSGVKPDGPAVLPACCQQPRLVFFQVDGIHAGDRLRKQAVFRKNRLDRRLDGLLRRAAAAADADAQHLRDEVERVFKRVFSAAADVDAKTPGI